MARFQPCNVHHRPPVNAGVPVSREVVQVGQSTVEALLLIAKRAKPFGRDAYDSARLVLRLP